MSQFAGDLFSKRCHTLVEDRKEVAISYPSSAHNDWHRNVLHLDSLPHGHAGQFCTQAQSCTTQLVDYCSCCIWIHGQLVSWTVAAINDSSWCVTEGQPQDKVIDL
ncbi:hypothetical protein WJX79_001906 [Trebouxia sp. C0005]